MRKTLCLFIFIAIYGCSTDNTDIQEIPSIFEVKVVSNVSINSSIEWSQSFDPQGKQVKYSVFLQGNRVVDNLINRSFEFSPLNPNQEYLGSVVSYDTDGYSRETPFNFTTGGDLPPNEFKITSTDIGIIEATINWSKAIDPENKVVVYDLYINDVLIKTDNESENYIFTDLIAASSYQLKVIAKDPLNNERILIYNFETQDGIYRNDLNLVSQAGVENFGKLGYARIDGYLNIGGVATNSNITDLSPLKSLKRVDEYIHISFVDDLTSLEGLELESVGGGFTIRQNDDLQNLKGLEKLQEVLGAFLIEQNFSLTEIASLDSLERLGNGLKVENNTRLKKVEGFNNVIQMELANFRANWVLTEISGFNKIEKIERNVTFIDSPILETITGFSSLKDVGVMQVFETLIDNINFLSSVEYVRLELQFFGNHNLLNINSLSSLKEITYGDLIISNNKKITNLNALSNLQSIGRRLSIYNNETLVDFCGLKSFAENKPNSVRVEILYNPYNPTINDIANGNCSQ